MPHNAFVTHFVGLLNPVLHSLQASVGALLPLKLVWAWEERLRLRELELWAATLRQRVGQGTATAGTPTGTAGPSPHKQQALSVRALLAWALASSWLLWLAMEVVLAA